MNARHDRVEKNSRLWRQVLRRGIERVAFPFENWNAAAYEKALRDEFEQLYDEGIARRRAA